MGWLHCHFMTGNLQPDDRLGDFTADRRVLTLTGMAALIGVISAFVALALLRLIGFFSTPSTTSSPGSSSASPSSASW